MIEKIMDIPIISRIPVERIGLRCNNLSSRVMTLKEPAVGLEGGENGIGFDFRSIFTGTDVGDSRIGTGAGPGAATREFRDGASTIDAGVSAWAAEFSATEVSGTSMSGEVMIAVQ